MLRGEKKGREWSFSQLTNGRLKSYSTKFIVTKGEDKMPKLALRSGSLLLYDDYIVDPAVSPTEIPCQAGAETKADESTTEQSARDEL